MVRVGSLIGAIVAALLLPPGAHRASSAPAPLLHVVRVGLGYLPDVQFAPFYLALKSGLYRRAGLDVRFQHGYTSELYPLLVQGKLDFVVGDAEDAILYRSKDPRGAPFRYVLALYQTVPNVIFSLAEKHITRLADLKGRSLGMPLLSGASYTSLQAMLRAAGLKESDLRIQQIGFTQLEAVLSHRVDAAMGFINNEPVVLAAQKDPVGLNLLPAAPYNSSAGNGVIGTDASLGKDSEAKKFLQTTQAAMAQTLNAPGVAFEASKGFILNLSSDRYGVLLASLPLYQSAFSRQKGLGYSNPAGWKSTLRLLEDVGRVHTNLPATAFYSNAYLQAGVQARKP